MPRSGYTEAALALRSPRSAPSASGFTSTSRSSRTVKRGSDRCTNPKSSARRSRLSRSRRRRSQEKDWWLHSRKRSKRRWWWLHSRLASEKEEASSETTHSQASEVEPRRTPLTAKMTQAERDTASADYLPHLIYEIQQLGDSARLAKLMSEPTPPPWSLPRPRPSPDRVLDGQAEEEQHWSES